jgi:hypothetical protein
MNNDIKAFELTDEQLEAVVGGFTTPPINVNPQLNINAPVNVSSVAEGNVILWSSLTNSPVGTANITQSNPTNQSNQFFV